MLRIGIAITVVLFCVAAAPARGAEPIAVLFPGIEWQQADPATAGWSADRLNDAETWSRQIGTTALIVLHHGRIVAQWGDTAAKTPLASVRKSLLSALFGNAVERSDISLKQTLAELGIDDNEPSLSAEEKTATVRERAAASICFPIFSAPASSLKVGPEVRIRFPPPASLQTLSPSFSTA